MWKCEDEMCRWEDVKMWRWASAPASASVSVCVSVSVSVSACLSLSPSLSLSFLSLSLLLFLSCYQSTYGLSMSLSINLSFFLSAYVCLVASHLMSSHGCGKYTEKSMAWKWLRANMAPLDSQAIKMFRLEMFFLSQLMIRRNHAHKGAGWTFPR